MIIKLAVRNLRGAGIRTWLNAFVLSLSFFTIIWSQGMYQGMQINATRNMIDMEIGGSVSKQRGVAGSARLTTSRVAMAVADKNALLTNLQGQAL